jgi:hypothetical protein
LARRNDDKSFLLAVPIATTSLSDLVSSSLVNQ